MAQWKKTLQSAHAVNETINQQLIELHVIICRTINAFANYPINALKKLEQEIVINPEDYDEKGINLEEDVKSFLKYLETNYILVKAKRSECVGTLSGHTAPILFHCQLRDGSLATSSEDNTIRFWNISTNQCTDVITKFNQRINYFIELKGGAFAFVYKDDKMKISYPKKNEGFLIFLGSYIFDNFIELRDGNIAFHRFKDNFIIVNITTRQVTTKLQVNYVSFALILNDGGLLLRYCDFKTLTLSNKLFHFSVQLKNKEKLFSPIELTDGRIVYGAENIIKIWNTKQNKLGERLKGHKKYIMHLFELNNGKLYSQSLECIILWDLKTLKCLVKIRELNDLILNPIKLKDGRLATITEEVIELWKIV